MDMLATRRIPCRLRSTSEYFIYTYLNYFDFYIKIVIFLYARTCDTYIHIVILIHVRILIYAGVNLIFTYLIYLDFYKHYDTNILTDVLATCRIPYLISTASLNLI